MSERLLRQQVHARWPSERAPLQRLALLALGVLLLGAATAAFAEGKERTEPARLPTEAVPIRLAGVDYLGDLPTFVAARQQLFHRHGLSARVSFSRSGLHNLSKLRAGELDFALMTPARLIIDRLDDPDPDGDDDPVILASLLHSISFNQIVFRLGSGISEPIDLNGRRVALPPGTNAELLWWIFSTVHGLDEGTVLVEAHPVEDIPALFQAGDIDAAVIWEPEIARVRAEFDAELGQFPISRLYIGRWVLVTRRDIAETRAEVCEALLATYDDAIEQIEDDGVTPLEQYAQHYDVPVESLRRNWSRFDYDLSLDWSLIAALQEQLRWGRQRRSHSDRAPIEPVSVLSLIAPGPMRRRFPDAVAIPNAPAVDSRRP